MNEQLKMLAEQAGVSFHHALGATYTYGKLSEILERFAELVDAAAVARERERIIKLLEYLDMKAQPYHNYYKFAARNIKEN